MEAAPGIDYAAVLADLKKRREDIDRAIAVIEGLIVAGGLSGVVSNGGSSSSEAGSSTAAAMSAGPKDGPIPSDAFFGMSISNASQKYLAMRKKPATTPEIAAALEQGGFPHQSGNFANTIHSVLTRNSVGNSPIFAKVKRGTWGLRSWYPGFRPKDEKDDD